jgi:deoxyadenosine/deoxycytidine kinase
MAQIITIEGNIGSGKSTLLAHLKEKYKNNDTILFLREPVDEWENIKDDAGVTMLQKFYSDQKTYSFPFQMMAYISRLSLLKEAVKNNRNSIIITERSLTTDKMVFAKMLFDNGNIEDVNYKIYLKWFDSFVSEYPINKAIYVNSSPTVCYDRIHERSRLGESHIPLEYLDSCDKYHTVMIEFFKKENNIEVLEVNGNTNIKENEDVLQKWLEDIDVFILDA